MIRHLSVLSATLAVATLLAGGTAHAGDIAVQDPWARASAGMARAGAAFMTIENQGQADRLVAASADVSATVELHTHIQDGDVMRMRRVDAIDVPADGMVHLKPGGLHVMFIGLKAPLGEGTTFPLTLRFEKAGEMTVQVPVKKAGAMGPGHGHHQGGGHGHGDGPGHGSMKTKTQ